MILSCRCEHEYQNKLYGDGKRVHNKLQKEPNTSRWCCTVCGTIQSLGTTEKKEAKAPEAKKK